MQHETRPADTYSLTDLARLADVTPRTIRYYISQGLLAAPTGSGQAARYGEGHLARLRLIRRLQKEHLPLAEIRSRLGRLSDDELDALLADEDTTNAPPPPTDSATDYIRRVLGGAPTAAPPPAPAMLARASVHLASETAPSTRAVGPATYPRRGTRARPLDLGARRADARRRAPPAPTTRPPDQQAGRPADPDRPRTA